MDPDSHLTLIVSSNLLFALLWIFLILLTFDLLLTFIRSVVTNASFADEPVDKSKPDRKAQVSFFNATSNHQALLEFAQTWSHTVTAMITLIVVLAALSNVITAGWVLMGFLIIPLLILIISGIISALGARAANSLAPTLLPAARFIVAAVRPFYDFIDSFRPRVKNASVPFDQIESNLIEWVEKAPSPNKLKEEERKMVRSILHFSDTLIREIMIPRVDLTAIELNTELTDAARTILASGHSRLPVYDDEIDNIVGILYAKDLIKYYTETHNEPFSLQSMIRQPVYVPESKKAGDLLAEMQMDGIHMVIVVDEYGGTAGIVSMEDIVEEIVGEIRDEYDDAEEIPIEEIGPDKVSFLGRVSIEDVNDQLHTHLTRDSGDTIAGLMYTLIGKVPDGDETITIEGWVFSIGELVGKRICRVFATRKREESEPADDGSSEENNTEKETEDDE